MFRLSLFLLLLSCLTPSHAQRIYTWVDENGVTHFDESPRSQSAMTLDMPDTPMTEAPGPLPAPTKTEVKSQPEIIMYSAAWCSVCKQARRFFRQNDIRYTEYDIETTAKGKRDYRKMNGSSIPIFLVDGQRYNGFAASRFSALQNR